MEEDYNVPRLLQDSLRLAIGNEKIENSDLLPME